MYYTEHKPKNKKKNGKDLGTRPTSTFRFVWQYSMSASGGGGRKSDCCSVWRMSLKLLDVTLATHCHTHYQPTFKFKDLVANQHLTNYNLPINTNLAV